MFASWIFSHVSFSIQNYWKFDWRSIPTHAQSFVPRSHFIWTPFATWSILIAMNIWSFQLMNSWRRSFALNVRWFLMRWWLSHVRKNQSNTENKNKDNAQQKHRNVIVFSANWRFSEIVIVIVIAPTAQSGLIENDKKVQCMIVISISRNRIFW